MISVPVNYYSSKDGTSETSKIYVIFLGSYYFISSPCSSSCYFFMSSFNNSHMASKTFFVLALLLSFQQIITGSITFKELLEVRSLPLGWCESKGMATLQERMTVVIRSYQFDYDSKIIEVLFAPVFLKTPLNGDSLLYVKSCESIGKYLYEAGDSLYTTFTVSYTNGTLFEGVTGFCEVDPEGFIYLHHPQRVYNEDVNNTGVIQYDIEPIRSRW